MKRLIRILLASIIAMGLIGIDGAGASGGSTARQLSDAFAPAAGSSLTPRIQVNSPWGKDDTVGEAFRPEGDLRRIIVENGHQRMVFTFRTVARPLWDTPSTDRITGMVFDMDWHGTSVPPNRTLVITREDNIWVGVILDGNQQVVCSRTGGVQQLSNNRFVLGAPSACLGGSHMVRVASGFVDDRNDGPGETVSVDSAPDSRFYGPFIRLPRSRGDGPAGLGGWTVH